ncbi:MaoC family dehydratase [Microvirga flavescens]|uniref:MaoC family dehydratase n=1 Tax=Microvirga flavescens TaxID=2249811 RepID=UPI000DD8AB9C|nr:MaoC family dehydratase N-terminal domain-containing protein [Microvirga flavescens]
MEPFQRYDEVEIGDVYPTAPLTFEVSAAVVDGFLAATGDGTGLYARESDNRRAPSMMASVYLIDLLMARRSPPGGIHAKQAIRFHRPLAVGETLGIQARVVDKYVRKERPYVVSDFEARGSDGGLAASGRITSIWGKDR